MADYRQKRKKKKMAEDQVEKIDFESGFSDVLKEMNGIPHGAKEIFLRDLVLNAAAALLRLRLDSLYEEDIEYGTRGLHIDIIPDKSNNTLSIVDNGTGMNKSDLKELFSVKGKEYLMDSATEICRKQVGVDSFYMPGGSVFLGFPAVFMVADSVKVTTRHYESVKPCELFFSPSDSDHRYFVVKDAVSSTPRGTKVTLKLNKDHSEYLDLARLNKLIDKYPIELCHYPITICSPAGEIIGQRLIDVKEYDKDINVLMNNFKGLEQLFKRTLVGRNLYLTDVVLSHRYLDIPAVLSLDRETLHISPRGMMMENLRLEAELNPDDEDVLARIDLLYMAARNNIKCYDEKHGTDNLRERVR